MIKKTLASVAVVALALAASVSGDEPGCKIVVNASNPVASLKKDDVGRMFLKKTGAWPTGQAALPVDQQSSAPARQAFSRTILAMDVAAVAGYWQQMMFSGRATPPPTRTSDADVLTFVKSNPYAIGYVSAGVAVGDGVKVIAVN